MFEVKLDTISNRLVSLRNLKGITQVDMAAWCNISVSAYKSYEKEITSIPHPVLIEMERIFKVSIDFILLGNKESLPKETTMFQIQKSTNTFMEIRDGRLKITNSIPLYDYLG